MWALIDNYDSFTHILYHYLLPLQPDIQIFRNDAISVTALEELRPERIIISPGPQAPYEAGITLDTIRHFYKTTPILGICLGHQALGLHFGAKVTRATRPVHGKVSTLQHTGKGLFKNMEHNCTVMRYHSLVVKDWEHTDIVPLAFTTDRELMAFEHKFYPSVGIQFHPESVLTEHGALLLKNWDESCKKTMQPTDKYV